MNLDLTEEQSLLQKTVREFAESEVRPLAKELDETGHFPHTTFKKAAELGLTGIALPESEGGANFDHIAYTIVIEEISRCCASTGVILSVQNSLYCDPIHRYGTPEQKKKIPGTVRAGEKNRLLRPHRAASRLQRRRSPNQSRPPRRKIHPQRHQSLDHQRRCRRRSNRLRQHASRKRRKRYHGASRRKRYARFQNRQGRKKTRFVAKYT